MNDVGSSVRGAVAAGSETAAAAAVEMLSRGGSAVDAAVAAAAVQCVVEFPWGGIGGDAFVLVREPSDRDDRLQSGPASEARPLSSRETAHGQANRLQPDLSSGGRDQSGLTVALNGSGAAPAGLETAVESGSKVPRFGPVSVAVPGFVDAVCRGHARFGTLPLTDLFAPAAELARVGVVLTGELGRAAEQVAPDLETDSPLRQALERALARPDRTLALPALAETLEAVAADGPDAFYRGRLAENMAARIRGRGGVLDPDDLAAHSSEWVEPITAAYRGATVAVHPPVSLGCVALLELRLYERLGLSGTDPDDPERIDAMVRCKHAALADALAVLGDDPGAPERAERLLSDEHVEARVQGLLEAAPEDLIHPAAGLAQSTGVSPAAGLGQSTALSPRAGPRQAAAGPSGDGADTTCVAVADGRGQQAVIIHSLFNEFGSRELDPATGVLLNDRLGNQTVGPGPGRVSGGRRPLHTLHAFSVERGGAPVMMGATPGGRGQFQTNFQVIVNALDGGMGLQAAIDAPRWLSGAPRRPGADRRLHLEPSLGPEAVRRLRDRGHDAVLTGPHDTELFGSVTAVGIDANGALIAAADCRREAASAIL